MLGTAGRGPAARPAGNSTLASSSLTPKITDFGLAKCAGSESEATRPCAPTVTGEAVAPADIALEAVAADTPTAGAGPKRATRAG